MADRKLTPDAASDLVKKTWSQYKALVIERLRPRWAEYYGKYRSVLEMKRRGGRESTLFIPRSFDSVETIVPACYWLFTLSIRPSRCLRGTLLRWISRIS